MKARKTSLIVGTDASKIQEYDVHEIQQATNNHHEKQPVDDLFLNHYLLLIIVNQMSSSLFWFIGSVGRDMIVANTSGSFSLPLIFAFGWIHLKPW
ncbi:hypothetical protein R6Q57_018038 [Mikania cordata]